MAKGKKVVEIPPERVEEIRADARSGRNWAREYWRSKQRCTCGDTQCESELCDCDENGCPRHAV